MKSSTMLAFAMTLWTGCTSPADDSAADDSGAPVDTDSDADTDSAAIDLCANTPASATTVSETQLTTAYPEPSGGTIVDGTYDLSRFEVYSPATADGHVRARRMIFEGDTVVAINVDDGVAQPILGGTWSTAGSALTFQIACPASQSVTLPFSVVGEELWLFDPEEPNTQVYSRQ